MNTVEFGQRPIINMAAHSTELLEAMITQIKKDLDKSRTKEGLNMILDDYDARMKRFIDDSPYHTMDDLMDPILLHKANLWLKLPHSDPETREELDQPPFDDIDYEINAEA